MDIQVNEIYDKPTYQGEGLDIGKPCVFVRLQHCPVKCPGCDSHFTWDGSEKGARLKVLEWRREDDSRDLTSMQSKLDAILKPNPGCGIVVSGGEPLLYYKHWEFKKLLMSYRPEGRWIGLETSGFIGAPFWNEGSHLESFLSCFTSIHVSPKITPCLHGKGWSDEQLLDGATAVTQAVYLKCLRLTKLALKFVCRDEADVEVVRKAVEDRPMWKTLPIYLMPFGQEPEEIIKTSEFLLPYCAKYGYILSPRLHSIFWGRKRGV